MEEGKGTVTVREVARGVRTDGRSLARRSGARAAPPRDAHLQPGVLDAVEVVAPVRLLPRAPLAQLARLGGLDLRRQLSSIGRAAPRGLIRRDVLQRQAQRRAGAEARPASAARGAAQAASSGEKRRAVCRRGRAVAAALKHLRLRLRLRAAPRRGLLLHQLLSLLLLLL